MENRSPHLAEYRDSNSCLASRFEFGERVFVGPAPEWRLSDPDLAVLSFEHRECVRHSDFAFAAKYEGEDRERDTEWEGPARTKQQTAANKIHLLNTVLWRRSFRASARS